MSAQPAQQLIDHFWPEGDELDTPQVYAVLDGARNPRIARWVRLSRLEYECLYRGRLSARLQNAAPYVVHLSPTARFTGELLDGGWGRSWGFFTRVPPEVSLKQNYKHLRRLLRVQDESGRKLAFRFYDPRVLRVYLPTCTAEEAKQFFGPVPRILAESEDAKKLLSYRCGTSGVETEEIPLTYTDRTPCTPEQRGRRGSPATLTPASRARN